MKLLHQAYYIMMLKINVCLCVVRAFLFYRFWEACQHLKQVPQKDVEATVQRIYRSATHDSHQRYVACIIDLVLPPLASSVYIHERSGHSLFHLYFSYFPFTVASESNFRKFLANRNDWRGICENSLCYVGFRTVPCKHS